jgi:hypothetical protein
VNDTTSTPDESDGRGRVATGEQAAAPAQPAGAAGTNGSAPAQAEEVVTAERPSDPTGADAPTAHIQLPPPPGGAASPTAEASAPEASAPAPSPAPRPPDPQPAPGPMPGPGPEAAAPPPWHRMAGDGGAAEPAPESAPEPEPEPEHNSLLDEGPTAFLEPPSRFDEQRAGSGSEADSSWSSVRTVRNRPPRQAALQLRRLDPWSVLKLGLVLAVVLFFIWLVAVGVLYGALDGMGVWDRLNGTYADLVSGDTPTGGPLISAGRVFGFAAVIGAINSLLFAVAVTVGAFVYNVSADLVGGIEVTLSERD